MIKCFRRLFRKNEGATAIEFALLVWPFLLLSLGIIELSIMYASASLLEGATDNAARLIRTGQLQQSSGDPEEMFSEAICEYATVLINCEKVAIEVLEMNGFSSYESMEPVYEEGMLVPQGFNPGGSGSQVLIRVAYRYHVMTPIVGTLLAGPDNSRLFMSTIVLQTEPYEFGS